MAEEMIDSVDNERSAHTIEIVSRLNSHADETFWVMPELTFEVPESFFVSVRHDVLSVQVDKAC